MIEFKGVSFAYADSPEPAVSGIDLRVKDGEFVLVAGRSGSGKTTLLRCMNGLVPSFYGGKCSGRVVVDGVDTRDHGVGELSRHAGLVFQDPENQFVTTSVRSEIEFGIANSEAPQYSDQAVRDLASKFGLEPLLDRAPSEISGGEKQKTIIASVLGMGAKAIVLDEPTSQLDPLSSSRILRLLGELNREGMTVVLSEHRLERALPLATRCVVLECGRIIFDGPPNELGARFQHLLKLRRHDGVRKAVERLKIVVDDLAFAYPNADEPVLKGLSMVVRESEILGLLAENGGGKSTLAGLLAGLLVPLSGRIEIDGGATTPSMLSRLVGIVFQDPNIHLFHETVVEEIEFGPRNMGPLDPCMVESVMELFGLTQFRERNPRDLSGGQKEKVAIASVVSCRPQILVLDEPTRGLDVQEKAGVMEAICDLRKRWGTTVVVLTHDLQLVEAYSDRAMIISDGRPGFSGAPAEACRHFMEGFARQG